MEVCGSHTASIARSGLKKLLPNNVTLVSGPGCPVCVTSQGDIDLCVELARKKDVVVATFGDMLKVPGSGSSLEEEKARGADVRIVYSPHDAVSIAKKMPSKQIVFIGVGFETTAPAIAAAMIEAKREGVGNFSVLSLFKTMPEVLRTVGNAKDLNIDGFILPGHVSAIIGVSPYKVLNRPGVISGFNGTDILRSVRTLLKMIERNEKGVVIDYDKVVKKGGNPDAVKVLYTVFAPVNSVWRGIGMIRGSGLGIRRSFVKYDAFKKFSLKRKDVPEPKGCLCGAIIKGVRVPVECKLFGKACTPSHPVGPCMVSSEGACSAHYRYGTN